MIKDFYMYAKEDATPSAMIYNHTSQDVTSEISESERYDEQDLQKLLSSRKYVPVAFVIESSTEHHDVFKPLL